MPSTFTTNLNLEKQATGENANTWGTKLNADLDQIDSSLAGNLTISVAGNTDVTPTTTQAQNIFHHLTGALTGSINYIVPTAGRLYLIDNQTSGAYTVTIKTSGGTGVVAPQGFRTWVYCDATNVNYPDTSQQSQNQVTATSTGSSGTYAVTLSPPLSAYATFALTVFKADKDSAGSDVININSLGNKNLKKFAGGAKVAIAALDIKSGMFVQCMYDGTDMIVLNPVNAGVVTGAVKSSGAGVFSQAAAADLSDTVAPTTWSPTDQSGGGLSFGVTNAIYYQIGKLVCVAFDIAWPSTADANSVLIGGLPVTSYTTTNKVFSGALSLNNGVGTAVYIAVTPNAKTFTIQSIAGSRPTNSQMSTGVIRGSFCYFSA